MSRWALLLGLGLGLGALGCARSPNVDDVELDDPERETPCANDEQLELVLACKLPQACPSAGLPRISTQLDAAEWTRVRALADTQLVAVALDPTNARVELIEACQLPGRYHEATPAPESPGRAWSSDRLVFLPDEPTGCEPATHFVASFAIRDVDAIRDDVDGEAIVLPLPCPAIGTGAPVVGCIGAGLDDDARLARVESLYNQVEPLIHANEYEAALPPTLELAALLGNEIGYTNLLAALRGLDRQEQGDHGGCLWWSEVAFALSVMAPDHPPARFDPTAGRVSPSHEGYDCRTRPSLLTCFADRFTPGAGGNCW